MIHLVASLWLAAPATPNLPVEKFVLDNGLEVLVHEDHRLPIVAVNVTYHVGALNEPADRTGFAHFFEHLMFQGSKHVGDEQHMKLLSDAGGSAVNGFTTNDYTVYLETVPTHELELALWLESDRMGFLLDTLSSEKLETQREVVKNERRQRFDNAPYGMMRDAMNKSLFPATHPYFGSVIGSMAHLDAASLDDVKRFFATYYAPSNATLCLAGDVTTAQAKTLANKWFGSFAKKPKPAAASVQAPTKPALQRMVLAEQKGKLGKVQWLWLSPAVNQPGEAELDFVASLLGDGESSRLYRSLVLEQKVASAVSLGNQSQAAGSMFILSATAAPGKTTVELEAALEKAFTEALATPFTDEELNRTKARYETQTLHALTNVGDRARTLQVYNHYEGNPNGLQKDLERHQKLTPAALQTAAKQYLTADRRATVVAIPQSELAARQKQGPVTLDSMPAGLPPSKSEPALAVTLETDNPMRATRPASGERSKLIVPKFQSKKLANGLTVIVSENHQFPLVNLSLSLRVGSGHDPEALPGVYGFLYNVIDAGTQELDAQSLDKRLGDLGTGIGAGSSRDGGWLSSLVLRRNLDDLLPLLAGMAQKPRLQSDDIERIRQQRLSQWLGLTGSPDGLAALAANKRWFGETSPYGHPALGGQAMLQKISADDLKAAHQRGFTPEQAALVMVGDITLDEAVAIATKNFGTWKNPQAKINKIVSKEAKINDEVWVVDMKGSPQTVVHYSAAGIPNAHPDEEVLALALDAFGGNFNSRLNLNLREDKGITYGARASNQAQAKAGMIVASSAVRAEATGLALQEMMAELQGLQKKPLSQAELEFVRNAWLLSMTAEFETNEAAAGYASNTFIMGEPLNQIEKELDKVRQVKVADLRKACEKYLTQQRFRFILVGDPDLIDKEAAGAGLKKLVHVSAPQ